MIDEIAKAFAIIKAAGIDIKQLGLGPSSFNRLAIEISERYAIRKVPMLIPHTWIEFDGIKITKEVDDGTISSTTNGD